MLVQLSSGTKNTAPVSAPSPAPARTRRRCTATASSATATGASHHHPYGGNASSSPRPAAVAATPATAAGSGRAAAGPCGRGRPTRPGATVSTSTPPRVPETGGRVVPEGGSGAWPVSTPPRNTAGDLHGLRTGRVGRTPRQAVVY